jgi:signal transduction histidine kinase
MKARLPRKARTRIALLGALVSVIFLALLALGARSLFRKRMFADIDEELHTLAVAIGSDFELEGLAQRKREALMAGLEANTFEFRLENHSAILFSGSAPFALSGDLLRLARPVVLAPYLDRPEVPYTAVEPYSGQRRVCRFLVLKLRDRAEGATLVLFRSIEPTLLALARLDRILFWYALFGFLGTALILAVTVGKALRPLEEVTRLAEGVEASDLSGRVRIPTGGEEFRRLAAVINSLLERLERAFRAQRRLIADAAHELKTPIAILVGEAQDALRPDARPEQRLRSLETIERAARGLAQEADDLLLLARGDAAVAPKQDVENLAEITRESAAAVRQLASPRSVGLELSLDGGARVRGDRALLLRLATNLLANAALYTGRGTDVDVVVASRGSEAFLEVRDRGPGVPEEDRSRIFERFVRLDNVRDRNPEGSGLGLAIVDQVARAHGGRVEVEARSGGGAIFRAVFPAVL